MPSVDTNKTVAEIAAGSLAAVKLFERNGIDYCCGGKRPLADVCEERGLDLARIEQELQATMASAGTKGRDWNTAPLAELVDHIVEHHHNYLRREMPGIASRLAKVYSVYNQRYGETFPGLPELYAEMQEELLAHIEKEERILFPAIKASEVSTSAGSSLAAARFRPVSNPIHVMEMEHEETGQALAKIREITGNYAIPDYACVTYRALIQGFQEMEEDIHLHIHLENNILFPRAMALESIGQN